MINTDSYNGNPLLRKAGVPLNFSADMISEWIKCRDDPIYFVTKYVQIVTIDNGLQPMQPYDFQKEIITKATNNRKLIVRTARQAGKSTTCAAFLCHYIIFNEMKTCAILANKAATSREILQRVQMTYEHLPKWLQHGVTEWNKGSFVLENGSRILAAATSSSAIRGFTISCVSGDSKITVMNDDGIIYDTTIENLYTCDNNSFSRFENITTGGGEFHVANKISIEEKPRPMSKYKLVYDKLIDRAKSRSLNEEYTENHHIIPKSLGGEDKQENIVTLTLREHFICHKLLVKIYEGKERSSMLRALFMMSNTRGIRLSSRVFAECRKELHIWAKNRVWTDEQRNNASEAKLLWWKENKDSILQNWKISGRNTNVSVGVKHYIENNHDEFSKRIISINTDPEKIRKTAEKHRGMKRSEDTKINMSISKKKYIENNGGPHNKNTKHWFNPETSDCIQLRIEEIAPEGYILGTGKQKKRGGSFYTDGTNIRKFYPEDIIPTGWRIGRK